MFYIVTAILLLIAIVFGLYLSLHVDEDLADE